MSWRESHRDRGCGAEVEPTRDGGWAVECGIFRGRVYEVHKLGWMFQRFVRRWVWRVDGCDGDVM